jgi:prevent-host-death family protein
MRRVATVPQKELRNHVGEVLRRAEAGEELTITVSGRPVAQLGPVRTRQWVKGSMLADLAALPPDPAYMKDIESFEVEIFHDPWSDR